MEKELQRQLHKSAVLSTGAAAASHASVAAPHCHNCGAPLASGAAFCEECGAPQGHNLCVSCGADVPSGTAVCTSCGHPATTRCTYCGAQMGAGEAFCPECGNPRGGIVCPACDTLNFRSFCRKCNRPLNPMALYAVEEARRDPAFIKAQAIAVDMAGMEEEIRALEVLIANRASAADEPEKVLEIDDTTSDSARRLLDEFERLSRHTTTPASKPKPKEPAPAEPKLSVEKSDPAHDFVAPAASDTTFGAAAARLEQLKKEYAAKAAQLQRALDAMVPDEEAPPEIKRNFACARMITTHSTVTRKEVSRVAWVCNRCNVRHNNPSECAVAEYGGRWEVQEIYRTYHTVSTRSINI